MWIAAHTEPDETSPRLMLPVMVGPGGESTDSTGDWPWHPEETAPDSCFEPELPEPPEGHRWLLDGNGKRVKRFPKCHEDFVGINGQVLTASQDYKYSQFYILERIAPKTKFKVGEWAKFLHRAGVFYIASITGEHIVGIYPSGVATGSQPASKLQRATDTDIGRALVDLGYSHTLIGEFARQAFAAREPKP